jgi:hypothetical protein
VAAQRRAQRRPPPDRQRPLSCLRCQNPSSPPTSTSTRCLLRRPDVCAAALTIFAAIDSLRTDAISFSVRGPARAPVRARLRQARLAALLWPPAAHLAKPSRPAWASLAVVAQDRPRPHPSPPLRLAAAAFPFPILPPPLSLSRQFSTGNAYSTAACCVPFAAVAVSPSPDPPYDQSRSPPGIHSFDRAPRHPPPSCRPSIRSSPPARSHRAAPSSIVLLRVRLA